MSTSAEFANKRNSPLRRLVSKPIQTVTDFLHHTFPDLHPDHLTATGPIGVAAGCILAYENHQTAAAAVLAIFQSTDAFDGPLARTLDREKPGTVDFFTGGLKDVASDRIQEWLMAITRALIAHEHGNRPGECLAYFSAITNFFPSLLKAGVEANKGVSVPESGQGALGLLGTRPGRAVVGTISTVFPEMGPVPVQPIADFVTSFSNFKTTADRAKSLSLDVLPALPEKDITEAKARFKLLAGLAAIGVLATIAIAAYQNRPTDVNR